jgi:hypothetical protein
MDIELANQISNLEVEIYHLQSKKRRLEKELKEFRDSTLVECCYCNIQFKNDKLYPTCDMQKICPKCLGYKPLEINGKIMTHQKIYHEKHGIIIMCGNCNHFVKDIHAK